MASENIDSRTPGNYLSGAVYFFTLILSMSMSTATNATSKDRNNQTGFLGGEGRTFQSISVHPTENLLLITECISDVCSIFEYNLKINLLRRYVFPDANLSTFARYSEDGKRIIATRYSSSTNSSVDIYSEISTLSLDGSHWQTIARVKGIVSQATECESSGALLYWKGQRSLSPTIDRATGFDVWELDFATRTEKLFAGQHKFFDHSSLQCISGNELLIAADGPRKYASRIQDYWTKYNRSTIYFLRRAEQDLPTPRFTGVLGASAPVKASGGRIFFLGEQNGIFIFQYQGSNEVARYETPKNIGGILALEQSGDGAFVYFIYQLRDSRSRSAFAIGVLNTDGQVWRGLSPPSAEKAESIFVSH